MIFLTVLSLFASSPALEFQTAMEIGVQVWQNECAGTTDGLISWNRGEEFASLGIGHFIWYPAKRGPFQETFPELLLFFQSKKVDIPRWLEEAKCCPWKTREEFLRAKSSKKATELRAFLKKTIPLQAEFLIERLKQALPSLSASAPLERKDTILANYHRLAQTPAGLYPLVDYVNCKGFGTNPNERYDGFGWGLLQVLNEMSLDKDPIDEFIRSAKQILKNRVDHAPPERNEQRFLIGWFNRIDSYGKPTKRFSASSF